MDKWITRTNVDKALVAKMPADWKRTEKVNKKDLELLTVGIYYNPQAVNDKGQIPVFTIVSLDWAVEYGKLPAITQMAVRKDGFGRGQVNRPAHENVKTALGLVETAKRIDKAQVLADMLKAGIDRKQVERLAKDWGVSI